MATFNTKPLIDLGLEEGKHFDVGLEQIGGPVGYMGPRRKSERLKIVWRIDVELMDVPLKKGDFLISKVFDCLDLSPEIVNYELSINLKYAKH